MDPPIKHQNIRVCKKHNQPIVLFEKEQKKLLCLFCLQENSRMVSIEKIHQELQEIKQSSDQEFQSEQQQLQQLLDSILRYKYNLIYGIDKIIQIINDQIKNTSQFKEELQQSLTQSDELKSLDQYNNKLKNQKEQHEQIKTQVKQLLQDFQQKHIKADYLNEILTESSQKIEKLTPHTKAGKIKIQEVKQEKLQDSRVFKYELIKESIIQENNNCYSFAFNKDNSILLIGCKEIIKIYQFINGIIGKELQVLLNHKDNVTCLYFMKKSNCFVSGSSDNSIIIWKYNSNNKWIPQQILSDRQSNVYCMLVNKNEDMLISGNSDFTVKFWKKDNDQWSCYQTIETENQNYIFSISLNETENKLITCGTCENIYVMEIQNNKYWSIKQKIKVDETGLRIYFTFKDQFVFQPEKTNYLEVFDYDQSSHQFKKQSQVQIQSCQDCYIFFQCKLVKSLNILLIKHGEFLNIFLVKEEKMYQLIQTIEYKDGWLFGTLSDDGQYLVTWDEGSKEIQLRKLNYE